MISGGVNRSITELLNDPMVQLMMRADRADREALADDLRKLACRLQSGDARAEPGICGACGS